MADRVTLRATTAVTFVPGSPGRAARLALWEPRAGSWSPSAVDETTTTLDVVVPGDEDVEVRTVAAHLVPVGAALDVLVPLSLDGPASRSARAWAEVARVTLALISRGRLLPSATPEGADQWVVGPLTPEDRSVRAALAAWLPPEAHCLALGDAPDPRGDAADDGGDGPGPAGRRSGATRRMMAPLDAVAGFADAVADVVPRTAAARVVSGQWAWADLGRVADVRPLARSLRAPAAPADVVVGVRLSFPDGPDEPFRADLQVRSATEPSRVAPLAGLWVGDAEGFGPDDEAEVLVALRRAARVWPPLGRALADARPADLTLDDDEAMALLGPIAADLRATGLEVLVPAAVTRTLGTQAHVEPPPGAGDAPARFDLATACRLTWRATVGGEPLSDAELSALAQASRPLVQLRGEWVVVDPGVAARLGRTETVSGADALGAALSGELVVAGEPVAATVDGAPARLAMALREAAAPHELAEPPGLEATLRPYQRRGQAWLVEMCRLGVGGVLADDMGLGKTIQVIAAHRSLLAAAGGGQAEGDATGGPAAGDGARGPRWEPGPMLVVCPASVVGNWMAELARFTPATVAHRYHGPDRSLDGVGSGDVVVTTYGIARRDHDRLGRHRWGIVVADEAQAIKNPHTAVARAMRTVSGQARVAMTGTPVENRLTELWALLDWCTPGLLGSVEAFRREVAIPVERDRDPDATERLARAVAPFLLRRRKDDPAVAPDLPPKTETDHPVALTAEQAALYRAVVEDVMDQVRTATGMTRRGLVLKLLTGLKQVCNHPAQYLREAGPLAGRSGKLDAFDDLVGAITDAGDAALVFTQYVAMGELLMARLAELGLDAAFLHGGLSLGRRTELVERFQEGGFGVFVISLRAGGQGLNLTAATHVVHYDRWWNPAVEDQASDRAWRIGQDRPVQVHRLVSEGTLEERIAAVLEEKSALAEAVVGSGEAWLTELDDDELAALVRLGGSGR